MIVELLTITAAGAAGLIFKKGPLRPPSTPPLNHNLISDESVKRCTLSWKVVSADPGDAVATAAALKDIVFPLDFNPTKFRITRSPYFSGGQSTAGARVDDANVSFATGTPYIEMEFMLDNSEVKDDGIEMENDDEGNPRVVRTEAEGDPQRRVYQQMRILQSMLEPIEYTATDIAKPTGVQGGAAAVEGDHEILTDTSFSSMLADTDQALFRKASSYKARDRQPSAVWLAWGPLEFLGTVRNLNMNVVAVDGHGNPRRVQVFLKMKGEIFRESTFYANYQKAPGGDVLAHDDGERAAAGTRVRDRAVVTMQRHFRARREARQALALMAELPNLDQDDL